MGRSPTCSHSLTFLSDTRRHKLVANRIHRPLDSPIVLFPFHRTGAELSVRGKFNRIYFLNLTLSPVLSVPLDLFKWMVSLKYHIVSYLYFIFTAGKKLGRFLQHPLDGGFPAVNRIHDCMMDTGETLLVIDQTASQHLLWWQSSAFSIIHSLLFTLRSFHKWSSSCSYLRRLAVVDRSLVALKDPLLSHYELILCSPQFIPNL